MAIFEYQCPDGHTTERLVSLAKRPDAVACERCGEPALRVLSATPTTFRANDRKAFKRTERKYT